jgi:hypothetical protein
VIQRGAMALNLEPVPENPAQKKLIATIVAGAAILALALTLFTHRWLKAGGDLDAGVGLFGVKICPPDGDCETMSNKEMIEKYNESADTFGHEKKSPVWWLAGYATFGMILLSIGALIAAIVLVHNGKFFLGSMAPTSISLLLLFLTLIVGMIFVATNPTKGEAMQLGVGWTFWIFGVGVVGGIVGSQMLNKFKPAPNYL